MTTDSGSTPSILALAAHMRAKPHAEAAYVA